MLANDTFGRGVEVLGNRGRSLSVISYIDDVTVICKSKAGLRRVKLLIDSYCSVSGFGIKMVNNESTFFFGECSHVEECGWKVSKGCIKILGAGFNNNNSIPST